MAHSGPEGGDGGQGNDSIKKEVDDSVMNISDYRAAETICEANENIIDLTEEDLGLSIAEISSDGLQLQQEDNKNNIKVEPFVIVENPDFQDEDFHNAGSESREEVEILPPPLTLDDPSPPKNLKRRRGRKKNVNLENDLNINLTFQDEDFHNAGSESREEVEILPPPLTLDDHSQPKNLKRRRGRKKNISVENDLVSQIQLTSQNVSQRFQRSCKDKIINYSEESLLFQNTSLLVSTEKDGNKQQLQTEKKYSCDQCGASFVRVSGLKRHERCKHSTLFRPSVSVKKDIKIECNESDKLSIEPDFPKNKIGVRTKTVPCPQCGRTFSLRCNMRRHLRIHLGSSLKHECTQCGKLCSSKQALIGHIRFIHTGERPYTCKVCHADFVTNSDLNRHQSKHTEERRFKCSDCGKGFKQLSALKQHIHRKRSEKLWQCELCAKKFSTKHSLKCHMVIHTNIKLYECESCQRQFSHKVSLEAHMRVHTGVMPFACSVCGKLFTHRSNRNRHVRQVHK